MSCEIEHYGAVLLQRDDPDDVCFTGRQNLGSPIGIPKRARVFETAADAAAFVRRHKLREGIRIVPSSEHGGTK